MPKHIITLILSCCIILLITKLVVLSYNHFYVLKSSDHITFNHDKSNELSTKIHSADMISLMPNPILKQKELSNLKNSIDKKKLNKLLSEFQNELYITVVNSDEIDILNIPIEELKDIHLLTLRDKICNNLNISNKYFKYLHEAKIPEKLDGLTAANIAKILLNLCNEIHNCDLSNLLMLKASQYTRYFSESLARDIAFDIIKREKIIESNKVSGNAQTLIILSYEYEKCFDKVDNFVENLLESNSLSDTERFNIRYWATMSCLMDASNIERYDKGVQLLKRLSEDNELKKQDREYCKCIYQSICNTPIYNIIK